MNDTTLDIFAINSGMKLTQLLLFRQTYLETRDNRQQTTLMAVACGSSISWLKMFLYQIANLDTYIWIYAYLLILQGWHGWDIPLASQGGNPGQRSELILNDFLTLAFSQLPTTMLTTVPSPMELLMFIEADLNSLLWIFSRIWLVNNRDLCNLC